MKAPRRAARYPARGWSPRSSFGFAPRQAHFLVLVLVNRTTLVGGLNPREDGAHGTTQEVFTGTRERAVRILRRWVRQAERDAGKQPGLTTDERQRLKQLEREVVELRRAN